MNKYWLEWSSRVAALEVRERVIVLVALLVVGLFIWGQFVFAPLQDRHKRAANTLNSLKQQQADLGQQLVLLEQRLADDPNRELRTQQANLQKQLVGMRSQIENQLSGLIAPEKMADVLRSMLHEQEQLKLISLKNLPVEPFHQSEGELKEGETALFSHSMELVLDGEYFDVLGYIKRLESLKGFNWQTLNYEVINYPKARVTLKISTLSLEEDWIGV